MPTSPRRLPVLKAATQPGISKSSGELYGSAPQGLADEILEDPLQLVVARILVVDGLQLKLILEAKRKQTSPAEREAALAEPHEAQGCSQAQRWTRRPTSCGI